MSDETDPVIMVPDWFNKWVRVERKKNSERFQRKGVISKTVLETIGKAIGQAVKLERDERTHELTLLRAEVKGLREFVKSLEGETDPQRRHFLASRKRLEAAFDELEFGGSA